MATPRLFCVVLCIVRASATILALPTTEPPLIHDHPFVVIWNAPTEQCQQLEIPLDTAAFQGVTTPAAKPGQFLTIFYEDHLGLYPKVNTIKHKLYRGGVPQNGNLTEHLAKVQSQIDRYIYQDSSPGLVVIDWESWRPLWDQNWGSKRIYQKLSISHALQVAPFLSSKQISKLAKNQFQQAGRRFMEKTISLGTDERPSHRWGFYLFPDCYNYDWKKPDYTGECSTKAQKQNNQMMWLWKRSTALFPSIYLHLTLRNSPKAALYVRNRVQEAMRVAALPKRPYTVPIYVYSRLLYRHQTKEFLSLRDLVSTVGESAALGASGVIMWGGTQDYNNKAACHSLSEYLTSTFNPYIVNVTAAAMLCSEVLCQGKGRCVRKNYNSTHYLHLNPTYFKILHTERKYVAIGLPSATDLETWAENFTCQCYAGSSCSPQLLKPNGIKTIWV
ncbi:hyaluronidase PH-20-like [Solea senegalensis]|uniref:Hyaluronidase n=1 Tax=Solea senegalensis TaxID=28829 RepID=A0AAV6SX12_SOLSE|nr:hyaluronidase PH-20-like [Solea senegalensis]KAG7521891.1 hyaluronidase PH-20-like [Solea senegalensis]